MEKQNMATRGKALSWQYLAGFFDGEGSVSIRKQKCKRMRKGIRYQLNIVMTNTHLPLLLKIINFVGEGKIGYKLRNNPNKHKPAFGLRLCDWKAINFLNKIKRYSVIKMPIINCALEYFHKAHIWAGKNNSKEIPDTILALREKYYQQAKLLNKRGPAAETKRRNMIKT